MHDQLIEGDQSTQAVSLDETQRDDRIAVNLLENAVDPYRLVSDKSRIKGSINVYCCR